MSRSPRRLFDKTSPIRLRAAERKNRIIVSKHTGFANHGEEDEAQKETAPLLSRARHQYLVGTDEKISTCSVPA
jgi:hypothetical protein